MQQKGVTTIENTENENTSAALPVTGQNWTKWEFRTPKTKFSSLGACLTILFSNKLFRCSVAEFFDMKNVTYSTILSTFCGLEKVENNNNKNKWNERQFAQLTADLVYVPVIIKIIPQK